MASEPSAQVKPGEAGSLSGRQSRLINTKRLADRRNIVVGGQSGDLAVGVARDLAGQGSTKTKPSGFKRREGAQGTSRRELDLLFRPSSKARR